MNTQNTLFYSTANTGYVDKAVVSLLSIRDWLPDAHLRILSSGLSDEERRLLDSHNISYHELVVKDIFSTAWEYPVECYYIFLGPELFVTQGYDYSVYIDGDVLCCSNPLQHVGQVKVFAGAGYDIPYTDIFLDDTNKLMTEFGDFVDNRKRVNTGIVYFNNTSMRDRKFTETIKKLYDKCIEIDAPRKGDDSLFALYQYLYVSQDEFHYLPVEFNYMTHLNKKLSTSNIVFVHFTQGKPWEHLPDDEYSLQRHEWWKKYTRITKQLPSNNLAQRNRYQSIQRLSRDQLLWLNRMKKSIVTRKSRVKKRPLKLYWWHDYGSGITNFGDEITKDIILRIFGYRSEYATIEEAEIIGAGSIIQIVAKRKNTDPLHIWGSGFIDEETEGINLRGLIFHAVRGVTSRNRIPAKFKSIPLGDPGILASVVYPRATYKTNKIGVVVHYVDTDTELVRAIRNDNRFKIIDVLAPPDVVAREISACKFILSSSLHGMIFADSFSVPNAHLVLSDKVVGGDYKFKDYLSGVGREYIVADNSRIFNDMYISELLQHYVPIQQLQKRQRKLIQAFPKFR